MVFSRRDCSSASCNEATCSRHSRSWFWSDAGFIRLHTQTLTPVKRSISLGTLFAGEALLLCRLVPRAARPVFQVHPIQQQLQSLRGQAQLGVGWPGALRPVKGAFLQALGQHAHTRAVEVKQFDPITPPVAEDKERATLGILTQALLRGCP